LLAFLAPNWGILSAGGGLCSQHRSVESRHFISALAVVDVVEVS